MAAMGACRQGERTMRRGTGGFTLTELLVVIGIAVLLMGLMIPTGRALRESNRAITCRSQLQQIAVALKAYVADEGAAPYYYVLPTEDTSADPSGPGLLALYETGYLGRRNSLHCPSDVYAQPGTVEYFMSYMNKDEEAAAATELNKYPYLSSRGIVDDTDPYYRRQIQPAAVTAAGPTPVPIPMPNWRPDDDTVITWCKYHVDSMSEGGKGMYYVLFWDGSVGRVFDELMTDPSAGPSAAWKVGHDDTSG